MKTTEKKDSGFFKKFIIADKNGNPIIDENGNKKEMVIDSSKIIKGPVRHKHLGYDLSQRLKKIFNHYKKYVKGFPYSSYSKYDRDARRDIHPEWNIEDDENFISLFWEIVNEKNIEDYDEKQEIMTFLYNILCSGMTIDEYEALNTNELLDQINFFNNLN